MPTRMARSSASSRPQQKFGARYATFGFNDSANLDDGGMWPTSFALKALNAAEESKDHRAREESGELRTHFATSPVLGGILRSRHFILGRLFA